VGMIEKWDIEGAGVRSIRGNGGVGDRADAGWVMPRWLVLSQNWACGCVVETDAGLRVAMRAKVSSVRRSVDGGSVRSIERGQIQCVLRCCKMLKVFRDFPVK
jgi:hypothetical protein